MSEEMKSEIEDTLSFDDRCKQWLEKQPNWKEKTELGQLLMIPLKDLTSNQLARFNELQEVLREAAP